MRSSVRASLAIAGPLAYVGTRLIAGSPTLGITCLICGLVLVLVPLALQAQARKKELQRQAEEQDPEAEQIAGRSCAACEEKIFSDLVGALCATCQAPCHSDCLGKHILQAHDAASTHPYR